MGQIVPNDAFPFCSGTYYGASPIINAERCVNLYPEPGSSSSKGKVSLVGRPGMSPSPSYSLPNAPARAMWAGNNRLFAVGGTHFFELGSGGSMTDYGAMAGSTGVGPCQIIANGTQLLVMDARAARVHLANTTGPVMTQVFNGRALEYLDGFYVSIAVGASLASTNPNQINVSNNGDGTIWDPLNYVIRTGSADLVTNLAVLNGQLWIFGERTIEVWYNAGNNGFPFARIAGATINLGVLSPNTVVKFQNTIMWLGADDRGYAQVYMTKGLSPVRVSNTGIEAIFGPSSWGNAPLNFAYGYQEAGHTFYVLCFVTQYGVVSYQYVYDLDTGYWHERYYAAEYPNCFVSLPAFDALGPNMVGMDSGKIRKQSITFANDGTGFPIGYTRTAPHLADQNKWIKYPRFELDIDCGNAQPTLSYSNDGGRSFLAGAPWPYNMRQSVNGGTAGGFRRFYALQLGRSRDRVFSVNIIDDTNLVRINNAYLTAEPGTEK